jgi:hypothetical protein
MKKLMKVGWVRKLRVNMHKTKYMKVTNKPTNTKMLKTEIRNMRG